MGTEIDLASLASKALAERDSTIAAAHAKYDESIRSIASVARLAGIPLPSFIPNLSAGDSISAYSSGSGTQLVREAIRELKDGFGTPHIYDYLTRRYGDNAIGRTAISSALNKLRHQKEIVLIQEGQGRAPSLYRINKEAEQPTLPISAD